MSACQSSKLFGEMLTLSVCQNVETQFLTHRGHAEMSVDYVKCLVNLMNTHYGPGMGISMGMWE